MKKMLSTMLTICLLLCSAAALAEPAADETQTLVVGTVTLIDETGLTLAPDATEETEAPEEVVYEIPEGVAVYAEDGAEAALADVIAGSRVQLACDAETGALISIALLPAEDADEPAAA